MALRSLLPAAWLEEMEALAAPVWQGPAATYDLESQLAAHEYARAL
jgi:hypothetical protein